MEKLISKIRSVPVRFLLLAGIGAVLVGISAGLVDWEPWRANMSTLQDGWGSLAAAATTVVWVAAPVLALRWPWPAAALALLPLLVVTAADAERGWPLTQLVCLIVCAMVAVWRSLRTGALLGLVALVPVASFALGPTRMLLPYGTSVDYRQQLGGTLGRGAFTLLLYAVVVGSAILVAKRMRDTFLAEQALLTRSAEVEHRAVVLDERARLALDLHDVVAHHVSLIAVRAETAPYTVPDLSLDARALVAAIADDSRRALEELRGVLGILHRSGDEPGRAPQPTAADIADLVAAARGAGDLVDWEADDLVSVSPAIGYVGYRVVQEALTNARRHAPGERVLLRVGPEGRSGLAVQVVNRSPAGVVVEGRGLVGMRERVEALGGTLTVEVTGGEVMLRASIPGSAG